jgi:A/G-specific adenine glycosylase
LGFKSVKIDGQAARIAIYGYFYRGMEHFSDTLIAWYKLNKRDLPWRDTKDPYKIWLSEIILQQTQVIQGLSYYTKFTEKYPTVKHLAKAPEDDVMKMWQGLGYYSRARNLHESAKLIVSKHKGLFPTSYEDIRALKGVGDYTAAAIASISYGLPYAVVDGNVYRVLSRVFGIGIPIDSSKGKKYFQQLANELLHKKDPATFNQAVMEFGARWCRPVSPDCGNCVLNSVCVGFSKGKVDQLPVKEKKQKIKNRYFHYFIFRYKNHVYIQKRQKNDIWKGLYQFYLVEGQKKEKVATILKHKDLSTISSYTIRKVSQEYKHILSHQHLYAVFYHAELKNELKGNLLKKVNLNQLSKYAFPKLIENHLREFELLK